MKTKFCFWQVMILAPMLISATGCMEDAESDLERQIKFDEELIEGYLEQNNIEAVRDNSGIYYQVLTSNTDGTPVESGDVISIRYVMRNLNGQFIDSLQSTQTGDTSVRFLQEIGRLRPEGINWGVRLMHQGEKFRFYIPSTLAFGNYSYKTQIPARANLIIDTEVVKVETEKDLETQEKQAILNYVEAHALEGVTELSSGIFYQQLSEGSGEVAKNGQRVEVAYKGYNLNNQVFDESKDGVPLAFVVNSEAVIPGFEEGIKQMKQGEKGRIFIPSHLAYGASIQVVPDFIRKDFLQGGDIRPYQPIIFEVTLEKIN